MRTWFSDSKRGRSRRWHLEEGAPSTLVGRGVCGRELFSTPLEPIERREELETIPESERCPVCEDVAARLSGPPARTRIASRPRSSSY